MDFIRITALTDIGNNIAYSSLVPIVDMAGTPTTKKANLQIVGNLILSGAGGANFAPAARSVLAQTVTNAAQPNITSVGTLTSLAVTGNIIAGNANLGNIATANFYYGDGGFLTNVSANGSYSNSNVANYLPTYTGNVGAGNVNATGTVYTSGISSTGLASLTILNVSTTANLGAVGNIRITGGSNGQVLTTDGSGNLSWSTVSGNGGLPLANGSSNFNIANANGNATVDVAGLETWTFDTNGNLTIPGSIVGTATINIDNRDTGNAADIQLYSADDITLQARDRSAGSQSEGGDININAGDSAEDGDSSGGDVTILAGDGGAANVDFGGSGGFITLQSGRGGAASTGVGGESAEGGGALNLRAGHGGDNNGNIARGAGGGSVYIDAGDSTGNGIVGGSIYLSTGLAGPNAEAGDLQIQVPGSDSGPGGTWRFNGMGVLEFPGGGTIRNSDSLDIGGGNAISLEAGGVVNIYSDTNGNAYQWQFGDDGNLTLPGNSSSINYANGTPYGGGGSGYTTPYEVATFAANTPPGFGQIEFANFEGANSAPATAQKLFINESPTNEQSMGTIFQQWTSNSYRGTLSLNNGSDSQATFNISNGRIYFEPENYRGFRAGLNQIWGDDCSINQLIITNASAPNFYNTEFLVENDVFNASGLATGNFHVMLNVYGSSQYNPINPDYLWNMFTKFVDFVLFDGETLRTDVDSIKTQFYNNTGNFRGEIPTTEIFQYFRFTNSAGADYFGTAPTTGGSGTGATVRVRVNANNSYTVLGTADPGIGYISGETITVLGTDLGGATPANDLTIFLESVDADGVITAVSYDSGTGSYPWPSNRISDGGDDQYDTGNYLNTNLAAEISYANGITQTDSAAFGGGDYCVMYDQSFFCMVATGVSSSVNTLFYSGNLGFDGDGFLNWTGLRSPQNVVANNNARYAYFDCKYLDGELTPTVGTTYNMTLDSAGINLDGFYAYYDDNVAEYFFGSNNAWRLESQQNLYVQSYADMYIETRVQQNGTGEAGPNININGARGSLGQREINAAAGQGGAVNVTGGAAGGSDGIDSLGGVGGSVNITGGFGSGNAQAGNVNLYGGEGANAGSINLFTDVGANSSGKVKINTYDGNTNKIWEFRPDGNLILPGNGYITNPPNSSLDPLNPNVSTMVLTPDPGYSSQSLVLDPTAPGHIHLRAPGANIDEPLANIFLGGEESSFEVGYYTGSAPNVFIHSGGNTWEFLNDGNLVFPRDDANGDPILRITGGTNPRILSEDASLAGPANLEITALYTKFTGSSGEAITIYPDDGEISGDANIQIWANAAGNTQYSWTFGNDGTLTVPSEGTIRSNDDIIMLQSYDTPNSISRNMRLGTDGALYLEQTGLIPTSNRTWLTIDPNAGNVEITASVGVVGSTEGGDLSIAGGAAEQSTFNTSAGGNVNITGGLGASDDGGGGGPGGSVNISAGLSADPVGVSGNVVVTVGGSIYTFTELDLNVTTNPPASPAPSLNGFGLVSAPIFTNGNGNVTINANLNEWVFDSTGNLTIPGSSGGLIKTVANASIGVAAVDNGTNNPAQLLSMTNAGAATSIVSAYATNATIQTNATGTINTWAFDSTGNLTLPGNTVAINFSNGSPAFANLVRWTTAPVANTSAGTAGQAAYDSGGNLYVCVSTNTWAKFSGTTSW